MIINYYKLSKYADIEIQRFNFGRYKGKLLRNYTIALEFDKDEAIGLLWINKVKNLDRDLYGPNIIKYLEGKKCK